MQLLLSGKAEPTRDKSQDTSHEVPLKRVTQFSAQYAGTWAKSQDCSRQAQLWREEQRSRGYLPVSNWCWIVGAKVVSQREQRGAQQDGTARKQMKNCQSRIVLLWVPWEASLCCGRYSKDPQSSCHRSHSQSHRILAYLSETSWIEERGINLAFVPSHFPMEIVVYLVSMDWDRREDPGLVCVRVF
jgi:hypothetical protein